MAKTELMLEQAGYRPLATKEGPTGFFGFIEDEAIRAFQADHGLTVDGLIRPGGETWEALTKVAYATPELAPGAPREPVTPGLLDQAFGSGGTSSGIPPGSEPQVAFVGPLIQGVIRLGSQVFRGGRAAEAAKDAAQAASAAATAAEAARKLEELASKPATSLPEPAPADVVQIPPSPAEPPKSGEDRFEQLVEEVFKDDARPWVESTGDPVTKEGNRIVAEACRASFDREFGKMSKKIKHIGGSIRDGVGRKLKELYRTNDKSPDPRKGSNRSDLAWSVLKMIFDVNTVDVLSDGVTPTARERRALEKWANEIGREIRAFPKLRPGMDKEKYAADASAFCDALAKDMKKKTGLGGAKGAK